jgi:hypothetical protein
LRLKAAFETFRIAGGEKREVKESFGAFLAAVEVWQRQHGYENAWWWPEMFQALKKLGSPAIDAVLDSQFTIESVPPADWKGSGYEFGHKMLRDTESYTVRLIEAMRRTAEEMPSRKFLARDKGTCEN